MNVNYIIPVDESIANSFFSFPDEIAYRIKPLRPSSRSFADNVIIVEPTGSFSGTIT